MNLYQLCYDLDEESFEKPVFLVNDRKYSEEQFQDCIEAAKFQLGEFSNFEDLIKKIESYGFKKIVTGYYNTY